MYININWKGYIIVKNDRLTQGKYRSIDSEMDKMKKKNSNFKNIVGEYN